MTLRCFPRSPCSSVGKPRLAENQEQPPTVPGVTLSRTLGVPPSAKNDDPGPRAGAHRAVGVFRAATPAVVAARRLGRRAYYASYRRMVWTTRRGRPVTVRCRSARYETSAPLNRL